MARTRDLRPDLLHRAAALAAGEACWEALELLTRRSASHAVELLRARAAELVGVPVGRDQLLAIALEAAAEDLAAGRKPMVDGAAFFLRQPPAALARLRWQGLVLGLAGFREEAADAAAIAVERKCLGPRGAHVHPDRLMEEAQLQKALWDDPRISADAATRRAMLCSLPRLVERASDLRELARAQADDRRCFA